MVLDGIEDPHNVGAILADVRRGGGHAASYDRPAIPPRSDGVVGKASAGALATARISTVVNIARAVDELKAANVWTIGLAGDAGESYTGRRLDAALGAASWEPKAAACGGLVRETCDRVVCIPMLGLGGQPERVRGRWCGHYMRLSVSVRSGQEVAADACGGPEKQAPA